MRNEIDEARLLELTVEIVTAHVTHNPLAPEALPDLIQSVFTSLATAENAPSEPSRSRPAAAVPIAHSVTPEYIVCLEDGKKLRTLKRHLRVAYGMTPDDYRARWGLGSDYPMVAATYAQQRSLLARKYRLGHKPDVTESGAVAPVKIDGLDIVTTLPNDEM